MFVSSATVEDYTIRLSLLEQLESLLCNSCHIVVELRASTAALKAVMEHPNVLSIHHKLKQFGESTAKPCTVKSLMFLFLINGMAGAHNDVDKRKGSWIGDWEAIF